MRYRPMFGLLVLIFALPLAARADWNGAPLPPGDPLPAPFASLNAGDALDAVYPTYSRATQTVNALRTREGHAARVSLLEARPWFANGSRYLVVAFGHEIVDGDFARPECGGCWRPYSLAVLRRSGPGFALVARTAAPEHLTNDGLETWLSVKGDGEAAFDLAPYRLTASETLIGVRSTWFASGSSATEEDLMRVVGARLELVSVMRIGLSGFIGGASLSESAIAAVPTRGRYYDFRVVTTTYACSTPVCDAASNRKQLAAPHVSIFRFDGAAFHDRDARAAS